MLRLMRPKCEVLRQEWLWLEGWTADLCDSNYDVAFGAAAEAAEVTVITTTSDVAASVTLHAAGYAAGARAAKSVSFKDWYSDRRNDPPFQLLDMTPIIRDIVMNPFRPVTFSPDWRTANARSLAGTM